MSAWWQFRALIRKNMLTLKRSIFMTLMEIFFPIILMLIGYLVVNSFSAKEYKWDQEGTIDEYLIDKGNFGTLDPDHNSDSFGTWKYIDDLDETHDIPVKTWFGLPIKPLTMICYNRFTIAFVGFKKEDNLGQTFTTYFDGEAAQLKRVYSYMYFEDIDSLNEYVTDEDYGVSKPTICFGIYFKKNANKDYSASLHYFNDLISHGIEDVPNNLKEPNEEMQQGPNMNDILKYSNNGYIQVMNIIANYMLRESKGFPTSNIPFINYGFAVQKYDSYKYNEFSSFGGIYFTFFIVLAYLCPLILYVLKMVVEKESRSKEVMKIMGMGEGTYFLSYFVEFFVVNIIYCFVVGLIGRLMFYKIPYFVLVLYLWLFGLNVFALAFFCQSFMDTTRLALIVSCLIYCMMLFVSAAVYDDTTKKVYKTIAAVLPPVNLLLGAFTLGQFQGMYFQFHAKDIKENYLNYSMSTCYIMFTVDFFIYLFLGYYLQNVIPHEYGVAKPWYFLFLPSYWCGDCCNKKSNEKVVYKSKENENNKKKELSESVQMDNGKNAIELYVKKQDLESNNSSVFDDNPNEGNIDFQNEDLYRDKNKKNDVFMLRNVTKVYGDGKMACNNISFNLFRNEIFALLGRNGAGKTSLINGKFNLILIKYFKYSSYWNV